MKVTEERLNNAAPSLFLGFVVGVGLVVLGLMAFYIGRDAGYRSGAIDCHVGAVKVVEGVDGWTGQPVWKMSR